jgi:hypothetical protein
MFAVIPNHRVLPLPPLSAAKSGRNHLNVKITPSPIGIGEQYSQTISNFVKQFSCVDVNSPYNVNAELTQSSLKLTHYYFSPSTVGQLITQIPILISKDAFFQWF